ncbi:MAG: hypothetical protein ACI3XM_09105 [Eubacteriales bacterium]
MSNEIKFRQTFGGGYKKEDVNDYIASLQAQFTGIEETLKNTINHQKEELDALRAQAAETDTLREQLEQLQSSLNDTEKALASCKEALCDEQTSRSLTEKDCVEAEQRALAAEEREKTLAEELDTLRDRCNTLDDENSTLTAQLQALKTEIELAKAEEVLQTESAEMSADAAKDAPNSAGNTDTAAENERLTVPAEPETVYPADYEALKLKAEQYDRMSAHVGAIMLKANANAEELVQRARAEAETMLSGVNAELAATRSRAQSEADSLIDGVHTRMADISTSCNEDILVDLEEIRSALQTMMEAVQTKCTEIDKKIAYAKEEMDTTAKAIINRATTPRVLKK